MIIPALLDFILKKQGNIVNIGRISTTPKRKLINPVSPRFTAVHKMGAVKDVVVGGLEMPSAEVKNLEVWNKESHVQQ